tara:strand:+ start:22 stop:171 length:150 start_codon:yes stop_codon:yes gene_type:complete
MKSKKNINELNIILNIIKKYPKIASGRKKYKEQQKRILRNIEIIKQYFQ